MASTDEHGCMVEPPTVDALQERRRHWEVAKYLGCTEAPPPSSSAANIPVYDPALAKLSKDPILTALAQLGVYRLGVDRAFISLIDSNRQYIIAEASNDTSLLADDGREPILGLAFGAGVVDTAFAVCEKTISVFTHRDGRFNLDTANVLAHPALYLIRDFREHEHFKSRPYVSGWPHMKCYVEVPLKNREGIVLGSYCVIDNKTRPDMTEPELRIVNEIASTIVQHLESERIKNEHAVASTLLKGLDSLVEGKVEPPEPDHHTNPSNTTGSATNSPGATITSHNESSSNDQGRRTGAVDTSVAALTNDRLPSNALPHFRPLTSNDVSITPDFQQRHPTLEPGVYSQAGTPRVTTNRILPPGIHRNFARAARILRESMDLKGVVFLDAFPSSFDSRTRRSMDKIRTPELTPGKGSESPHADQPSSFSSHLYLALDSDVRDGPSPEIQPEYSVPSDILQSLVERYPKGHTFHYDDQGLLPTHEAVSQNADPSADSNSSHEYDAKLSLYFPGARSIIFAPLWVPSRKACYAGCFGWSVDPRRVMDLTLLNFWIAFGHSVMAEVARLETLASDNAKSDFISSISHELRSPLHGILGSVDLLREMPSTHSQQQMIAMIGKCGKTLLDTLNHLLDFAKIVSFVRSSQKAPPNPGIEPANAVSDFNLSVLVEDVVDAVLAGDKYRHGIINYSHRRNSQSKVKFSTPAEPTADEQNGTLPPVVIVSIEKSADRIIRSESGGWRRVLMNLLGNALKYTAGGYIKVSVYAEVVGKDGKDLKITMSVKDSGKGISKQYLQRKLYMPFSQENTLAEGIGLGLSIVKQIADSLGGTIDIDSQVGIGTEIVITATAKLVDSIPDDPILSPEDLDACKALRIGLLATPGPGFTATEKALDDGTSTDQTIDVASRSGAAIARQLEQWFNVSVTTEATLDSPLVDFFVISRDQMRTLDPDQLRKHDLLVLETRYTREAEEVGSSGRRLYSVPSSVGPRRLAHALSLFVNQRIPEDSQELPDMNNHVNVKAPSSKTKQKAARSLASIPHRSLEQDGDLNGSDSDSGNSNPGKPYVLLVDDNPINLNILTMYMTRIGCAFATAANGHEAVEAYTRATRRFDYVLMDVSMPVMDGFSATRAIRKHERDKGMKPVLVVALTGLGDADARREASASGVDLFWAKPVPMKQIKALIMKG